MLADTEAGEYLMLELSRSSSNNGNVGHGYIFRVRAIAKEGSSPFSVCVNAKVPGARRVSVSEDTRGSHKLKKEKPGRATSRKRNEKGAAVEVKDKTKLVEPIAALRWRRMPWYRRYPFISIPFTALSVLPYAEILPLCILCLVPGSRLTPMK